MGKTNYQVIMLGDSDAIKSFCEYLGYSVKSKKGLLYFEFPNEKFTHKSFLKLFKFKLRIYILQPQFLNTIMAPTKEFRNADAVIMLSNNENESIYNECMKFFEKFAINARKFKPILIMGWNSSQSLENWNLRRFYTNLEIVKAYQEIFGTDVEFLNINQDQNEAIFFLRLKTLLIKSESEYSKEYSRVAIENKIQNLSDRLKFIKNNPVNQGIPLLAECELKDCSLITRHSLKQYWGLRNENAIDIMNFWDERIKLSEFSEEDMEDLEYESQNKLEKCIEYQYEPNLANFLSIGYDFFESKKSLAVLKKMGEIDKISYHNPPEEYKIYKNLQDVIVLYNGRTLYTRTSDTNHDSITLFSGLIQTMEIVRDQYLESKKKGIAQDWLEIKDVDFLEFGSLHAILGSGEDGLKTILRFTERPNEIYIKKTQDFIKEFEATFSHLFNKKLIDLKEISPKIDELFFRFYNPFPNNIPYNKKFQVSPQINLEDITNNVTELEMKILETLKKSNSLSIDELINKIAIESNNRISQSDVLQLVVDLIKEKFIE